MIEFISRLPQGYQEVEYIESSGTQFIDTGFVPNDNTEIILVFTNNNATTGNYDCIFGTRTNASNDNTFALWIDPNRRFGAFYGTGQSITLFPTSINATAKHTATMKGRVAEIDGISITCSATSSSPAYSFYIGACNTAGTADYFSKILIYESKIYDNVTLVRDFVPCYRKADNVAGLYDLVNNVFYTNAGSGVFAVGSNMGEIVITPGGVISFSAALRRRMMINVSKSLPISELPLGTLINVGTDGGAGTPNYEIADKDNLVSGGVVLVRKNIHSKSAFGSSTTYPGGTLDNKMTSIYNSLPERLQSKIMDATFALEGSGSITRKVFALTYTMAGFGTNNGTTEGKALQYYTSNANRNKTYNGSAGSWWLSSRNNASYSRYVSTDGTANFSYPSLSDGVVPAFIILQSLQIEDSANTDGSYNLIL